MMSKTQKIPLSAQSPAHSPLSQPFPPSPTARSPANTSPPISPQQSARQINKQSQSHRAAMQQSSRFFSFKMLIISREHSPVLSATQIFKFLQKSSSLPCCLRILALQNLSSLMGRFSMISMSSWLDLSILQSAIKLQRSLLRYPIYHPLHKCYVIATKYCVILYCPTNPTHKGPNNFFSRFSPWKELAEAVMEKGRTPAPFLIFPSIAPSPAPSFFQRPVRAYDQFLRSEYSNIRCSFTIQKQHTMDIESNKKSAYLDEYRIIRTLGAGYHAEVKLGADENGNTVAIKKYKKETATLDTLKHELGIMKQLDHQNLVKLISVRENATYKNEDETTYGCFAIVLEFVGGGELFDFVAETGKFSEKVARTYFHQMMNGLHYMHQKGYAHRDIKPENLLLSHLFILKIADFGFSTLLKGKDGTGVLRTKLGTEGYMAPQIPSKKYEGKSVDIFASGVILFIMYAGNPPFEKATPTDPYYKILKEKKYDIFWKAHSRKRPVGFFSDSFKDLFQRLVAFEPTERLRIEDIASHAWVKDAVCTHTEIKDEFNGRQKKLDVILNDRRMEQEKQRQQKVTAVSAQGSVHRGSEEVDSNFVALYNKEFHIKRDLPTLEVTSKDDILRKELPALSVSLLKSFFENHEIKLNEDEQEELIGDETDILKFSQIIDNGTDKITVVYTYSYEIEEQQFEERVEIEIQLALSPSQELLIKFDRIDGNLLYYKKIVNEIRQKCFA